MADIKDLQTSSLLEETLQSYYIDPDSKRCWECVHELHRRGAREIFEQAKEWCRGEQASTRILGANILAQLGDLTQQGDEQLRPFTRESLPLLAQLLDDLQAPVVAAAVSAFSHHYAVGPIVAKPELASHSSPDVRFSVAHALCTELGSSRNASAIDMLLHLSEDEVARVRDWATFGLGSQCHLDAPEIREALLARLHDGHQDTRDEALIGLARRGDTRVIPFVIAALASDNVGTLAVEAAGFIGSQELVAPLEALRQWWDVDLELLEAAIGRCKGRSLPDDAWRWAAPDAF